MKQRSGQFGVLGLGITGQSVVRYLLRNGVIPTVYDTRNHTDVGVELAPEVPIQWQVESLADCAVDTLIISPGLDWNSALMRSIPESVEVLSDIDLFFEAVEKPVIGVTGTNGKSTVTSLVEHLLCNAGIKCKAGGNLGHAALDLLQQEADSYVLELSSFQLERTSLLRFATSSMLNLSEDHLDKHSDLAAYRMAKQRIYSQCDLAVFNRGDLSTFPDGEVTERISFGLDIPANDSDFGIRRIEDRDWLCLGNLAFCAVDDLSIQGSHNVANALAACALTSPWLSTDQYQKGLATFTGLAHRFEVVAEHHGVRFVNDSKATNVGAAVAALDGFAHSKTVVLLGGGDAKGADLEPFVLAMKGKVKMLVATGQDGGQLVKLAQAADITAQYCAEFADAVNLAYDSCEPGDTLLMSPGCASIDSFPNFKVRGETFAHLVHQRLDPAIAEGCA